MMMDFNGNNRGYAFVTFSNKQEAKAAMKQLNNYEIRWLINQPSKGWSKILTTTHKLTIENYGNRGQIKHLKADNDW